VNRLLITGATGFIGRHCLPFLKDWEGEVHAVSSSSIGHSDPHVQWHRADLCDAPQLEQLMEAVKPSHLLHLAWCAAHGQFWSAPENLSWVEASLHLLKQFAKYKGKRIVMAGTCAEYDWKHRYCSEYSTPLIPSTLYGASKHGLQTIAQAYSQQEGLSFAWGRIFHLYGPGEHPSRLIASVIRSLLAEKPALCSHGRQIRDYMHVADVASAFTALLKSDVTGAVNIASGTPIALKDVIYEIADQLERRDLVQLGALAAPVNDPELLLAAVDRLHKEACWHPKIPLREGIDRTIAWWKSHEGIGKLPCL
jgi:nucleoside-diphosphate-sugar epimerase